ncbi:hypothetical protein CSC94_20650 [Zhengella mangrovi]|uniref:Chain-length determining protein n=1 Tax=Zhengella mangrovi TaxID=1982044 RepID=A0A2G1QI45_9HYPH|nr:GumC family protein [Zhengella mangrovi]PHP65131.1 hypothetical protein CSC94_20650 [Zhengella mangrovi]
MQFDIWRIVLILRSRLWLVALCAIVFAGLTAAFTMSVSPVYRSTARVLIEPAMRQPFDNSKTQSRGGDDPAAIDSRAAMIASDAVLRPVVQRFKLVDDPEFGAGGKPGLLSRVMSIVRGSSHGGAATPEDLENKAVNAFSKAVKVNREGLTYIISISVDSENPDKAASLAQAVAESFLTDAKRHRDLVSAGVTDEIEKRVAGLRERLTKAEMAVQQFKAENRLQSAGQQGLLVNQELAEINTQLTAARAALAEKKAYYDALQAFSRGVNTETTLNVVTQSPRLAQLQEQYLQASREEARLAAELLPRHPRLVRSRSEVARLRGLLNQEGTNALEGAKVDLQAARERVANLESAVNSSRSQTDLGDAASVRLRELETEAQTTRTLYENILGRAKEIAELDQVVVPDARIISPAVAADSPIWPKKKLLVALALVLGTGVGLFLAVGGEIARMLIEHLRRQHEDAARSDAVRPAEDDRSDEGGEPGIDDAYYAAAARHLGPRERALSDFDDVLEAHAALARDELLAFRDSIRQQSETRRGSSLLRRGNGGSLLDIGSD